jgi:hypothetical protein
MTKLQEFETYAKLWVHLINKLGGTHLGYFLPSDDEKARNHGRFSFPGIGTEGPTNVAIAIFSFPDWNAYVLYRSEAGKHEECRQATKIVEDSQCFTKYERNFMTQVLG